MTEPELKLYYDYKSPFAYLAAQPAFELPTRYAIRLRWLPFQLRIKGPGQRSVYSDWKARYSYQDARRWANRRGGFMIRGPLKIYDSTPALVGGIFAEAGGFFRPYTEQVFARFFRRELEIDEPDAIEALVEELGHSGREYRDFLEGEGARAFERVMEEAHEDHVFGVPLFILDGEQFWGHDRIPLLEERLRELGLGRS
jgi:2-hydroxychromene-2-carboxylate isomerase